MELSLCECFLVISQQWYCSFRARIGASGPCTCCLHSYKASGCLRCNVLTLISRQGLLSVRDTVEALCKCFLAISQQWSGRFRHGSVRRDRARASCTATRLVAGRGHLLICGHGHLFDGDTVELFPRVFSEHIPAVVLSFRARIGASGPSTCSRHSYKAGPGCNLAILILHQYDGDTVELSL